MHIRDLTPDEGERAAIFGGTRAGKSALQEWSLRTIQHERPDAMQVLVDTKPRFRAETETGLRPGWRRSAAHRYTSWSKGPIVPNSVVVDHWSSAPFRGTFKRPGEVVILQSGEAADWKRILALLDAFTKANVKGRERRIVVDECLDFTIGTLGESTLRMTYFIVLRVLAEKEILAWTLGRIESTAYRRLYCTCYPVSRFSTFGRIPICAIYGKSGFQRPNHRRAISSFVNTGYSRAVQCRSRQRESWNCRNHIWRSYLPHERG